MGGCLGLPGDAGLRIKIGSGDGYTMESPSPMSDPVPLVDVLDGRIEAYQSIAGSIPSSKLDEVAQALGDLACFYGKEDQLLHVVIRAEASNVKNNPTLFLRSPSLGSRLIGVIFDNFGSKKQFLKLCLRNIIDEVVDDSVNLEINPEKETYSSENLKSLLSLLGRFVEQILEIGSQDKSSEEKAEIPEIIGTVCTTIKSECAELLPDTDWRLCLSAFVFLRLICPAVVSAKIAHDNGLLSCDPGKVSSQGLRNLVIFGKCVFNASTGVKRSSKEPWLSATEEFNVEAHKKLCGLMDRLARHQEDPEAFSFAPKPSFKLTSAQEVDRKSKLAAWMTSSS